MLSFRQFITETQEFSSAKTSRNQVSSGLRYAAKNLIKPGNLCVDHGGGKYDKGKEHVEDSVKGAEFHVHDPFNRTEEHNQNILNRTSGNADYASSHNVLNVIKEPEHRKNVLEHIKKSLKPGTGIGHITVYEGTKKDQEQGARETKDGWQNFRSTESYMPEVSEVFPEDTHEVTRKGPHIIIRQK